MRVVFAGTASFGCSSLALLHERYEVVEVYCQPDRPSGRGRKLSACPVKQLALSQSLVVHQPEHINHPDVVADIRKARPDVMVVVAYGQLLSSDILQIPQWGCLNVHASLLPKWRGAAPIQRAVEAGDVTTGVSIMQVADGVDDGDVLLQKSIQINQQNSAQLKLCLAELGADLLVDAIDRLADISAQRQDHALATYAKKIDKAEALINWYLSAHVIEQKIRAFNPSPMCYAFFGDQRVRILEATVCDSGLDETPVGAVDFSKQGFMVRCSDRWLKLDLVQPAGKKVMRASDFARGIQVHL